MDLTETYIKMLEKATEIHEHWDGSLFQNAHSAVLYGDRGRIIYHLNDVWAETGYNTGKFVKLLHQDQLQEMVFSCSGTKLDAFELHAFWCFADTDGGMDIFESMEQLWLAFVMKEKYGKMWNGEDWVSEK